MDTDKLRILLVGDYPPDPRLGSPKVLYRLRDEFVAAGHDAELLLADKLGAHPRSRHMRDLSAPWLAWTAVKRLLDAGRRYDAIDASGAEALIIARQRDRTSVLQATAVIARSHGLEHLNYARMLEDARHGLAPRPWYRRVWYPATRMRLVARAARRADKLIVANESDRAFAIGDAWKTPDDVVVISHGLSEAFLRAPASTAERAGLLFCGSWDAVKGIHYLVDAFGRLSTLRPGVQLTVLGPGVNSESVVKAFPEHARARVRVVPRCEEARVIKELQQHAALVMCSTFEGFGMIVPEAMALGLAVIATPTGAAASLIRDDQTGLLVPPRDAERLALAMARVLDDGALRARLGAAAQNAVRWLTWRETARRTMDVYRAAIRSRAPAGAEPSMVS